MNLLLDKGSKLEIENIGHFTPLHLSINYRFIDGVKELLNRNANVNHINRNNGYNSLMFAVDTNSFVIQFSKILTNHGNVYDKSWLEYSKNDEVILFYYYYY